MYKTMAWDRGERMIRNVCGFCKKEIDLAKDFGNYYVHPNKEISCVHCTEQFFKIKESYKSLIDNTTEMEVQHNDRCRNY